MSRELVKETPSSRPSLLKTQVDGCYLVKTKRFFDNRGYFEEAFHADDFADLGLPGSFPQDNRSYSYKGVLRGIHSMRREPQGKLVRVTSGRIWDVCVDLRPNSPTFLKHHWTILEEGQNHWFYIPPGCGHAFVALTDASVYYKCTEVYKPEFDGGVNFQDPELRISWPYGVWLVSDKDRQLPMLADYLKSLS